MFVCLFVFCGGGGQENGPLAKQNDKTERAKGLGRKTGEAIRKGIK